MAHVDAATDDLGKQVRQPDPLLASKKCVIQAFEAVPPGEEDERNATLIDDSEIVRVLFELETGRCRLLNRQQEVPSASRLELACAYP